MGPTWARVPNSATRSGVRWLLVLLLLATLCFVAPADGTRVLAGAPGGRAVLQGAPSRGPYQSSGPTSTTKGQPDPIRDTSSRPLRAGRLIGLKATSSGAHGPTLYLDVVEPTPTPDPASAGPSTHAGKIIELVWAGEYYWA